MEFKTVAEAYEYYKNKSAAEIEARAKAIQDEVASDPEANVEALNIELEGLQKAKEGMGTEQRSAYNPILGNFFGAPVSKKHENVLASPEYRSGFFKQLLGRELTTPEQNAMTQAATEQRAAAFNTLSDSAAVIPTETLNEVVRKARTQGGLIDVCRAFNMPANIAIPVGTPGDKAAWHTEGAAVDSEKVTTANVVFNAYEIMKVLSISAAVKKMSISAFEGYLTDELSACVMETIADALVNGTGSAQGTGVLRGVSWHTTGNNVNVTSVTGTATYADVVATVARLARGYSKGAKWAMSNADLYNVFYGMVDDNGRPVFIADPKSEGIGKILGFDVVVDDYLAAGTILFGNFDYMGYNIPQGIAIEQSTQSSFKSGLIDYRALAIADTKVIVPEAFQKIAITAAG